MYYTVDSSKQVISIHKMSLANENSDMLDETTTTTTTTNHEALLGLVRLEEGEKIAAAAKTCADIEVEEQQQHEQEQEQEQEQQLIEASLSVEDFDAEISCRENLFKRAIDYVQNGLPPCSIYYMVRISISISISIGASIAEKSQYILSMTYIYMIECF